MDFKTVVDFVEQKFELPVVSQIVSNMMLIKINGLDNYSLAKYIYDNLDGLTVTVKEKEGYKFNNLGWVKVERSNNREFIQTREACGY
jgi:hypothetical protein